MNVLVTLTSAGTDTGPFNLYCNADNYIATLATGISREVALAGYLCTTVPNSATIIRVQSLGTCSNYVDLAISFPATTTTSTTPIPTTTTTTTPVPPPITTTTTTTAYVPPVTTTTTTTSGGGGTTTTTTTAGGGTTTTTTTAGGGTTTTTTTIASTTTTTTTANVLCDLGNIVITAMDGIYTSYSYTTCGGTPVSQPGGTGTMGQILESAVCVLSGTFSNSNGSVQLNPTGSCA